MEINIPGTIRLRLQFGKYLLPFECEYDYRGFSCVLTCNAPDTLAGVFIAKWYVIGPMSLPTLLGIPYRAAELTELYKFPTEFYVEWIRLLLAEAGIKMEDPAMLVSA